MSSRPSLQKHSLDSILRHFGHRLTHVLPPCRIGRQKNIGAQLVFKPDAPCLGEGSFGIVRLAKLNGYEVATKYLKASSHPEGLDEQNRVEEEGLLLAQKRHNHIVVFYGYSRVHKCIIMEYCPNGSLHDFIRAECPKKKRIREDFRYRLQWLEGLAAAFVHLHWTGYCVIHRDLKSSNVVLDKHYEAKVTDFGLARIVDLLGDFDSEVGSHDGDLMLLYQAPEVMTATSKRSAYSTESDVYSFGMLMQEIITLRNPYDIEDGHQDGIHAAVFAVTNGTLKPTIPEDRSSLQGRWDPCLEELVDLFYECVSRDPAARPDFRKIYDRIRDIREKYDKATMKHERPKKWSTKVCCACLFIAGALMLAVCVGLPMTGHQSEMTQFLGMIGLLLVVILTVIIGLHFLRKGCGKIKPVQCSFRCFGGKEESVSMYLPGIYRQHSMELSPFELAANGQSSLALPGVWHNRHPTDWQTFCRGVLDDLNPNSRCSQVPLIRRFCLDHSHEVMLTQAAWTQCVRYFLLSTEARCSPTWMEYERQSTGHAHPHHPFQGGQLSIDSRRTLAGGSSMGGEISVDVSDLSIVSGPRAYSAQDGEVGSDRDTLESCQAISRSASLLSD